MNGLPDYLSEERVYVYTKATIRFTTVCKLTSRFSREHFTRNLCCYCDQFNVLIGSSNKLVNFVELFISRYRKSPLIYE